MGLLILCSWCTSSQDPHISCLLPPPTPLSPQVSDERHEGKAPGFGVLARGAARESERWRSGPAGLWEAVSKEKQKAEDEKKKKVSLPGNAGCTFPKWPEGGQKRRGEHRLSTTNCSIKTVFLQPGRVGPDPRGGF